MGFYAPAQLVRDAREHGVEVRPIDLATSRWKCTLEGSAEEPAVSKRFDRSIDVYVVQQYLAAKVM